jgi:tight adherence protein B
MTDVQTWVLVALSFVSLIGFGFSGLLVSQAHARRQKAAQRMLGLAASYRKNHVMALQVFRPSAKSNRSLVESAASIFGFHPGKADQYPVRWWVVLGVALVAARVAAGFVVGIAGPLGLISMPILWVVLCRTFFGWVGGRRRSLLLQQFPDALDMIVRSVRVGIPVLGAITAVTHETQAPTSLEFARFASALAVGVPLDEAATEMGARNDLAEYRFFAIAIGLQAQTGGGLSETLENLADLIRKRLALRERGRALSSEARTSALILGGLPVVLGGGLWLINPGYMSVMVTTDMGHKIFGAAVLSLSLGALSMRTIIKKTLT